MRREHLKTETCDFALSYDEFMEEQVAIVSYITEALGFFFLYFLPQIFQLLPYNSPYLDLFNAELTRLHQMGLIQRWIKEYLPKKDRCSKQSNVIEVLNHIVTMDDMQGSFYVLVLGFGAGFFFFFIECIWRYYRKRVEEREVIKPFVE